MKLITCIYLCRVSSRSLKVPLSWEQSCFETFITSRAANITDKKKNPSRQIERKKIYFTIIFFLSLDVCQAVVFKQRGKIQCDYFLIISSSFMQEGVRASRNKHIFHVLFPSLTYLDYLYYIINN